MVDSVKETRNKRKYYKQKNKTKKTKTKTKKNKQFEKLMPAVAKRFSNILIGNPNFSLFRLLN